MFDQFDIPEAPKPTKDSIRKVEGPFVKEVTVVMGHGWGWKKLSFWTRWQRVWLIERTHPEFGTKWYYDASKLTMPFDNYAHRAHRMRYGAAVRLAEKLRATYPAHQIKVIHETEAQ